MRQWYGFIVYQIECLELDTHVQFGINITSNYWETSKIRFYIYVIFFISESVFSSLSMNIYLLVGDTPYLVYNTVKDPKNVHLMSFLIRQKLAVLQSDVRKGGGYSNFLGAHGFKK